MYTRQNKAVLVVEDNEAINFFLRDVLGDNYVVTCVGDVRAALASLQRQRPDVILLDCLLPGGGATDVLRGAETMGCPVVLTSGDHRTLAQLSAFGHPCLPKPYRIGELLDAIWTALAQRPIREVVPCASVLRKWCTSVEGWGDERDVADNQ
jgi:DNA-binding response OmpR family regulator